MGGQAFRLRRLRRIAAASGAALVLVLGAASCSPETPATDESPERPKPRLRPAPAKVRPARTIRAAAESPRKARTAPAAPKPVLSTEDRPDLSPSDRKTLLALEKALEDENLKAARTVSAEALHAASPEVRSECVDVLGWFGAPALAELTPFLSDADPDVADNALATWTVCLDEIEDERVRCETVGAVMAVLKNPDALETLVSEISDCDDALQMQTVVGVIEGENAAAAQVAREHYEFITGEEFTTVEAAEAWLRENASEEE